jgi:hypothetical protein
MSLISAVTSRGHMRFMIKEKGGVNADVFIEFLIPPPYPLESRFLWSERVSMVGVVFFCCPA